MAEYYSAELSQKVKRGMRETKAKGNFGGGFILFGYRIVNKKVPIYEDEAQIVRQIFEDCASGKLIKTIIEELQQKGIYAAQKSYTYVKLRFIPLVLLSLKNFILYQKISYKCQIEDNKQNSKDIINFGKESCRIAYIYRKQSGR